MSKLFLPNQHGENCSNCIVLEDPLKPKFQVGIRVKHTHCMLVTPLCPDTSFNWRNSFQRYIIVSFACYNKLPQTFWLKKKKHAFSYSSGVQILKPVSLDSNHEYQCCAPSRGFRRGFASLPFPDSGKGQYSLTVDCVNPVPASLSHSLCL
jgi:hypothetical protein